MRLFCYKSRPVHGADSIGKIEAVGSPSGSVAGQNPAANDILKHYLAGKP